MGIIIDYEKIVEKKQKSTEYEYYKYGEDYYKSQNTYIMQRKKKVYLDQFGICDNVFQANYRLPSGYFKKIVDQKVGYVLGNGIKFAEEQNIDEYFNTNFDNVVFSLGLTASKKSIGWLYAYKESNMLKFVEIAPEQCYPVYDEYGNLKLMIRELEEDGIVVRLVYDADTVQRWEYKKRKYELVSTQGHYNQSLYVNGKKIGEESNGFGVVPFISLCNNREQLSDLVPIKQHIDIYDVIMSDFANNIDDMQDAYFTLKGYSGDISNLTEFMKQLKQIKAVPVGEDGDITAHQLQIPTEARKVLLELIEGDIYESSMSLNVKKLTGGSITNVVIKAMMIDLDLKSDQFEWQVRRFVSELIEFINKIDNKNYTDEIIIDRSMIMNRSEYIDDVLKTGGYYSRETIRELLPYEIDLKQEKERIEEEITEIEIPNDMLEG